MCISGFSNLIFHLLRGRVSGENCHFRLRSTTSGTHFDPHNTHSCAISVYGRQLPVHISIPTILIHVPFPSTVDNFRYTFRSPQYSFIASYDARNELKRRFCYVCNCFHDLCCGFLSFFSRKRCYSKSPLRTSNLTSIARQTAFKVVWRRN